MMFDQWKWLVDQTLHLNFAIGIEDAGIDDSDLAKAYFHDLSPDEYVEWFGQKYDLVYCRELDLHPLKTRSR